MKIRTHVNAGQSAAATDAAPAAGGGWLVAPLAGDRISWRAQLGQLVQREVAPWFTMIYRRGKEVEATQRPVTSASFAALDAASQAFARRWLDPLFDDLLDRQRRSLTGDQAQAEITPTEKSINRYTLTSVATIAAALAGSWLFPPLLPLSVAGALYTTLPVYVEAYEDLVRERRLKSAFTYGLAITGAWLSGQFVAGALAGGLYYLAQKLFYKTEDRARRTLTNVFGQQPRSVWLVVDGIEVEVPFERVQTGDTVIVQAGQIIPVDGTVTHGTARIDQHMLTGEAQPVEKGLGDVVLATTTVLTGAIHIQADKTGAATAAAQIADTLHQTSSYQLSIESRARRVADDLAIPSLLLSGLAWPMVGLQGAIATLMANLGWNVQLTGPLAMLNYLNLISRNGSLVKDGRSLELLNKVDTVVFDKASVLTLEEPRVAAAHAADDPSEDAAPAAAGEPSHPALRPEAKRVIELLRQRNMAVYLLSDEPEEPTRRLAHALGIDHTISSVQADGKAAVIERLQAEGKSVCFVGDGINDALALNKAHVSISLRGAATAAVDAAQIVLMDQSLNHLVDLFDLAGEFHTNLQLGIGWAIVPDAILIGGVFLAGAGIYAALTIDVLALVGGVATAMWPRLTRRNAHAPGSKTTRRKRKPESQGKILVAETTITDTSAQPVALPSRAQWLFQATTAQLAAVDERYQRFVQKHVDPLLGKTRHGQLREMLGEESFALSPDERLANRRFGLGMTALTLSLVGQWVFAPLIPLAIVAGLLGSSAAYLYAYEEWKKTKRLSAIHLLCVYSLALWLGGNSAAGGMGAALFGLMLKTKTLSENRSRNNLISMFQLQPDKVWVRSNGSEIEIPFNQLQLGDTIVLHAGQVVPVDGTIVAGVATIDQHMLTGEGQPVEKRVGDAVLAATLLISGQVDIVVEKTSTETTAGQIAEVLNRTANDSKPTVAKGVATADRLVVPTLALSLVSLPFIGPGGAVSLIGANSTYTSYLSGSLSMLNFLNLAAQSSVLIKDAHALEQLSKVNTIVFDKTGTLTLEQPHIAQIHTLTSIAAEEVLRFAAAAEARQTHPIARAILDAAAERNLQLPAIDQAHYEVGYGIKVRLVKSSVDSGSETSDPVNSESTPPLIRVGSARFMTMEGIALPEHMQTVTEARQVQGHSLVMVAVNDELVGAIELQPTVRPEAQQIIQDLREHGLDLYIISGDQEAPTRTLAHQLGMTGYFANTLPEAKADLVAGLQAEGRIVCFIGDGINDAIAMRQAAVSISLRGATTVATDTAQIILMKGNLNQLFYLFQLAGDFERNRKHNVRFTTCVSAVAVSGILLAGFTFVATEVFYAISLFGGLVIAMRPLLTHRKQDDNI